MDRLAHLDARLTGGRAHRPVAVIGAGYGGLAAAVELAERGFPVTVFEVSRALGGRARSVHRKGLALDNGQHLLIGAYTELLRLMREVGADPDKLLLRLPLTLVAPGRLHLRAAGLPAPLHLAVALGRARGLSWFERWAVLRFMRGLKARGFHLARDTSVRALLNEFRQPAPLCRLLWEPLCVGALNTRAEEASAQVFAHVLRDSLAGQRQASDLLLPRVDLSELFPEPAAIHLARQGAELRRSTPIRAVLRRDDGYVLEGDGRQSIFAHVVLAVAPYHVPGLLAHLPETAGITDALAGFEYEPIVTCYLQYDATVALPVPMIGGKFAQWLFDRGRLGGPPGLIAAVISARGPHVALPRDELVARIHAEVASSASAPHPPHWSQVIVEKRATFRCVPDLDRPGCRTPMPGLYLCGDYVASDYPATLESAVRSGVECARLIAQSHSVSR